LNCDEIKGKRTITIVKFVQPTNRIFENRTAIENDVFNYSTLQSIVSRVYIMYTDINNGPQAIRFENNIIKSMIGTESKYHSRFQNQQNPVQRLYLKRFAVVIDSGCDCTFATKIGMVRNLKRSQMRTHFITSVLS
jgi:hypothetical protein